ncbi:hypothetical protein D3C75_783580 [compost metagenome]
MHRAGVAQFHVRLALHGHRTPAELRLADALGIALARGIGLAPQAFAIDEQGYRVAHLQADRRGGAGLGLVDGDGGRNFVDDDAVGLLLADWRGAGAGQADQLLLPGGDIGHRRAANDLALRLVLFLVVTLAPGEHPHLQVGRCRAAVFQPQCASLLVSLQHRVDRPDQHRGGRPGRQARQPQCSDQSTRPLRACPHEALLGYWSLVPMHSPGHRHLHHIGVGPCRLRAGQLNPPVHR